MIVYFREIVHLSKFHQSVTFGYISIGNNPHVFLQLSMDWSCPFVLQVDVDEDTLSPEEQKDRRIMKLLLKIKNGTPPMRKAALRQITDKAREMGAGALFNQILPLLMSPTLEDQERHLLVKVCVDLCAVAPAI